MKIVFIRHFPTPGNRLQQYIGWTDEPLDMEAVKEILKKADDGQMSYPQADCIVTSPMKRCIQTAELLYPNQEIIKHPKLKECNFGMFECRTYDELKAEPDYVKWIKSGGTIAFPGGESRTDFQKRCVEGAEEILDVLFKKKCETAAFVVHGGTIMSIFEAFDKERRGFYHWQVPNGMGYVVQIDDATWQRGEKHFTEIEKICFM